MTYLSNQEAVQLLNKLRSYPVESWVFDSDSKVLSLRTPSGGSVDIQYRSWPGWEDHDWGQVHRQYRLSINGTDMGGFDEDGKKQELWNVVDLKTLFDHILADDSTKAKLAEKAQKKAQFKIDLAAKDEEKKKALLASV